MSETNGILIRLAGAGWSEPEVRVYDNELHLQQILAADPARIPGLTGETMTVMELPTPGGYIDVCAVSRDGTITVVECKLASNSERRRTVIGQVIDYAAAVWQKGAEWFLEAWRQATGQDLAVELDDAALAVLRRNIGEARIDLCLAVDSIDDDLRRLVEYLNLVTSPDVRVTALQMAYAKQGDVEILIPSTFGGELAEAKARDAGRGRSWTKETFIESLATAVDQELAAEIFTRAEKLEVRGDRIPLWFGKVPGGGIYVHVHGLDYPPAWFSINTQGFLMVGGTWNSYPVLRHHDAYAPLAELMELDHHVGSRSKRVAAFDLEELWTRIVECGIAINSAASDEPGTSAGS